jgi:hypothetical protein
MAEETVPGPSQKPSDAGEGSAARRSRESASPYSTGGGGVTFERRVGALYLARMLTGDGAPELGDAREVRVVAFQQAPRISVDDLVVEAARPDETEPSLVLAIGIRRRPNLVRSDDDSQKPGDDEHCVGVLERRDVALLAAARACCCRRPAR